MKKLNLKITKPQFENAKIKENPRLVDLPEFLKGLKLLHGNKRQTMRD